MPILPTALVLLAVCALSVDPDEHAGDKRPPLFTISPETTVIDGPLTPHGTIDYIAHFNKQFSQGVTTENNAAVLLAEAFGPEIVFKSVREETFAGLGIAVPAADGDYVISLDACAAELSPDDIETMRDRLFEEWDEARGRPWSVEEFPELHNWLTLNEPALELVYEASHCERFYLPLFCPQGNFLSSSYLLHSHYLGVRESARLLTLRATIRLERGDVDGAWEDLKCVLRLASLIDDSQAIYPRLVAIAAYGQFYDTLPAILASPHLDEPTARRILDDYAHWKGIDPLSSGWEEFHRMEALNCVQELAAGTISLSEIAREMPLHGTEFEAEVRAQTRLGKRLEFVQRVFANLFTDWDASARMVNRWYDRCGAILDLDSAEERHLATEALDKEFDPLLERYWFGRGWQYAVERFISRQRTRRMRGDDLGALILAETASPLYVDNAHSRYEAKHRLTEVGLALALYRIQHGEYPADLAALVPECLSHVPLDPYTHDALVYRPEADGYLLYSIGPNFADDNGVDIRENSDDHDVVLRVRDGE